MNELTKPALVLRKLYSDLATITGGDFSVAISQMDKIAALKTLNALTVGSHLYAAFHFSPAIKDSYIQKCPLEKQKALRDAFREFGVNLMASHPSLVGQHSEMVALLDGLTDSAPPDIAVQIERALKKDVARIASTVFKVDLLSNPMTKKFFT